MADSLSLGVTISLSQAGADVAWSKGMDMRKMATKEAKTQLIEELQRRSSVGQENPKAEILAQSA